jgi:tetratricopeptide (TPR) repeat protein
MIRKLQLALIAFVMAGSISTLMAQSILKKANKQYELKAFELAAYNYNIYLKDNPESVETMISLARCFAAMNNDLTASKWFEKASERVILQPDEQLAYGKILMKLANYRLAKNVFKELAVFDPVTAEHYLLSCDFAEKALKLPLAYEIGTFGGNTPESDFGLTAFSDSWVYMSFRNDLKEKKQNNKIAGSKLFSTGTISSGNTSVSLLRAPIRSSYQLGPVSYSDDMKLVSIMKNNFKEGYQPVFEDDEDQSILLADVEMNGDFINERPFRHNEIGSSTAFPCLAFNGSALYFSSNRSGGQGGYDLYVSYFKDGNWTMPENLGNEINTPGNEITPYFDDHTLFFASDYHHGLGGYDLFKTVVYNGNWSFPENMGNGVNSPSDDLYPFVDEKTKKIYFSSNRLGSRGNLDIFSAYRIEEEILAIEEIEPQVPMVSFVSDPGYTVKSPQVVLTKPNNTYFSIEEEKDLTLSNMLEDEVAIEEDESALDTIPIMDKPAAVKLNDVLTQENDMSSNWIGARMVGFNQSLLNGTKVYFIQLAALSKTNGNPKSFEGLSKYGNIYRLNQANMVKIRLGYFLDEAEAKEVLRTVKTYGYKDAFVTHQTMNTSEMELMLSNSNLKGNDSYMVPSKYKGKSNYKVRLASYEDPIWFDIAKAKDLGKIEQWTKGGWTIFIMSGYNSLDEAERARIKAVNKGFADAEIVYDNDGILERLKKN